MMVPRLLVLLGVLSILLISVEANSYDVDLSTPSLDEFQALQEEMEASVETEDAEDDEDYEEEADGDEGDDDLLTVVKKEKLQQEEREKQLLQKLEILENAKEMAELTKRSELKKKIERKKKAELIKKAKLKKMELKKNVTKVLNAPLIAITKLLVKDDPLKVILDIYQGNSKKVKKDDPLTWILNAFQKDSHKDTAKNDPLKWIQETLPNAPKPVVEEVLRNDPLKRGRKTFGEDLLENLSQVPLSVLQAILKTKLTAPVLQERSTMQLERGVVSDVAGLVKIQLQLLREQVVVIQALIQTIKELPFGIGDNLIPAGVEEFVDFTIVAIDFSIVFLDTLSEIPFP